MHTPPDTMPATEFRSWQQHAGLSVRGAAAALGLHPGTIQGYRDRGAPAHIALACAALSAGLSAWSATDAPMLAQLRRVREALDGAGVA